MKLLTKLEILLLGIVILFPSCSKENRAAAEEQISIADPELQLIHEKFDFTVDDFKARVFGNSSMSPSIASSILENPESFLEQIFQMMASDKGQLILVDKAHALESDYQPAELVELSEFPDLLTAKKGLKLERGAAEELVKLSAAAGAEGVTLLVSSTYRSYEYQKGLFRRFAERDGEEMASRYSAREGTSQHQLGTTVDFGDITNEFAASDAGVWMEENAGLFGWSLSYPEGMEEFTGYNWESWHWRWIGVEGVIVQDEYFDGSQQQLLEYWNENAPVFTEALIQ